jgi:GST-like protein
MPYTLYAANGSGSGLIEAALAELRAPVTLIPVDARRGAHRDAAYAALNPHRKLPTLRTPEGELVTESAAILLLLCERHPEPELMPPPGSPQRAQALRWLLFAATELYPLVELIDHPERFAPDEPSRPGVRDAALRLWQDRWLLVEAAIGEGPYLLGERFCAADLYFAAFSTWDLSADFRRAQLPKVCRLAATVAARPALAEIWPRNYPLR